MKCPLCGGELKKSQKNPDYGLCYNCRKKFKWRDKLAQYNYSDSAPKKKGGCLKITLIVIGVFIIIGVIATLFQKKDTVNDATPKKAESTKS